jgi:hypothetical protein
MDAAAIITVYRFAHVALERNLAGLTDSEALARVHALLGLSRRLLGKAGAIA